MANVFNSNPIYIDDFSNNVNFVTYYPIGLRIFSIEWVGASQVGHKCKIRIRAGGIPIIDWTCFDVNRNISKELHGRLWETLYIAKSEIDSGKLIILVQ